MFTTILWLALAGSPPRVRGNQQPPVADRCPTAVHPRVCGEIGEATAWKKRLHGSPPRVRGNRVTGDESARVEAVHPRVCGEIVFASCRWRSVCKVHPRVCGEI